MGRELGHVLDVVAQRWHLDRAREEGEQGGEIGVALADGSSPDPDYTIKGKTATKVFHAPGGAYYTRTRADVWFRTVRDARGAGFTERTRRHS